ncbi:ComEA family DNA-binding protein [Ruminococcus sp. AM29-19LB]|nr:ComEA family DNA-binding protein [Ruminococcus sp. AM57-5]RGG54643.1 ComEA family DNA-binding protein [Ruminococcus sp. AF19-4LB]RGH68477.1 ComEA family DNA-binding protein [Ruminococcus sp. AM29-5AC]RGH71481.1 ComEA family DNA-binding protein [Ruminococcus sp. AM29-1LB]RGH75741.1 ComEA family DNA-binding protein [Ruminococcus sp. AM29-19LB]RGH78216.1 ComEA family DNA-binding protein [Ruminococcus sp. AM29-10LB]RGH79620.1 ComEA family DNA-binding protein [Ruminococcus sp. AM29-1]
MAKGIVLTLALSFLTMGLCGCAEKHDAAEELEEFTLEGESDVEKNSSNSKTESEKASQSGTDAEEGLPETLYVHVCGAVNAPGVYELKTDARIYEALEAAGGMTEDAAADWINQAEALSDGERIYVPTQEEAEESAQSVSGRWADPNGNAGGSVSDKININTAAKEELMTLSGIGASKAESILKYRQEHGNFQNIEDLKKIEGIKDGVFNKIKDDITV